MLALAAVLSACGGGEPDPVANGPVAALSALRTTAAPLATQQSVPPAQAADQLFAWAEAHLAQYFPGHKVTGTYGPFAYRYYPETGLYLGVVIQQGSQWTYMNVYVTGGVVGTTLLDAGPLTKYITPVATSAVPLNVVAASTPSMIGTLDKETSLAAGLVKSGVGNEYGQIGSGNLWCIVSFSQMTNSGDGKKYGVDVVFDRYDSRHQVTLVNFYEDPSRTFAVSVRGPSQGVSVDTSLRRIGFNLDVGSGGPYVRLSGLLEYPTNATDPAYCG